MNDKLTHIDESGNANMVDVGDKDIVKRTAEASGKIYLSKETLKLIEENNIKKGDVISVARIAGIMGAKHTSELIPLCHNISIEKVSLDFTLEDCKYTREDRDEFRKILEELEFHSLLKKYNLLNGEEKKEVVEDKLNILPIEELKAKKIKNVTLMPLI